MSDVNTLARGRMHFVGALVLVAVLMVLSSPVGANPSAQDQGQRILELVDAEMQVQQRVMTQTMTLENDRGQRRSRTVKTWNRDRGEKMLVQFLEPADVADTALLLVGDDMWLYLPATGRVRRIAGHAKRGNFMGSDFSYADMEDIGSRGFGTTYAARYLGDDTIEGRDMKILELTPETEADYTSLTMWVDAERYLPRRIEYYDDDALVKELETGEMEQISGRWTATFVTMHTLARGTTTKLSVEDLDYDSDIPDERFSARELERRR